MPTLHERIEAIIRAWPQWSRAERAKMPQIVAEIMEHVKNGTGNGFIAEWCARNLAGLFDAETCHVCGKRFGAGCDGLCVSGDESDDV
jgi:hypothetical protein